MAIRQIPARAEVTCDACMAVDPVRKQEGKIIVKQHALDYQGFAVANGGVELDLCDHCLGLIIKAVNTETEAIRRAVGKTSSTNEGKL